MAVKRRKEGALTGAAWDVRLATARHLREALIAQGPNKSGGTSRSADPAQRRVWPADVVSGSTVTYSWLSPGQVPETLRVLPCSPWARRSG
jgi:hypothetical protein